MFMKIAAFEVREDENEIFQRCQNQYKCDIHCSSDILTPEIAKTLRGYDAVTTLGRSNIDATLLDTLLSVGISAYATRTVGMNHIDVAYAKQIGIQVVNVNYPPNGVADYTIMLMLMAIRHFKQAMWRTHVNDYSLRGLLGREINQMTVGVAGTGNIGSQVIKNLSGFGCRILAYDKNVNQSIKDLVEYVSFDELLKESDIITFHIPLLEDTYHIIDKVAIQKMKDQVVLINCARGELMDPDALIHGIENQKIGALGLDVFEGEVGIYHEDKRSDIICNPKMAYLRQFPNVIMTQHMAFYTDVAVENMVEGAIKELCAIKKDS